MKYLMILLVLCSVNPLASNTASDKEAERISTLLESFAKAVEERDLELLNTLLHPDFRVVANRFKGGPAALVLSREAYLSMMKE